MNPPLLFVTPSLRGSQARQLQGLAIALARRGWPVYVARVEGRGTEEGLGARGEGLGTEADRITQWPGVRWLETIDARRRCQVCGLKRQVRALRPKVVQLWGPAKWFLAFTLSQAGAPVWSMHFGCEPWTSVRPLGVPFFADQFCQRVLCNGEAVFAALPSRGLSEMRLRVLNPGVPPEPPTLLTAETRTAIRRSLDVPEDAWLIGARGAWRVGRRVKDVIWAADLLKAAHPHTHLVVSGHGPQADRLWLYRHHVRIADRVHFADDRDAGPEFWQACDAAWSAGSLRGVELDLLEAAAAGLPIVAANVPGCLEVVNPSVSGYLTTPGSRAELARKMHLLLLDPTNAAAIGAAGRTHVLANYSQDAQVDAYESLLNEM